MTQAHSSLVYPGHPVLLVYLGHPVLLVYPVLPAPGPPFLTAKLSQKDLLCKKQEGFSRYLLTLSHFSGALKNNEAMYPTTRTMMWLYTPSMYFEWV